MPRQNRLHGALAAAMTLDSDGNPPCGRLEYGLEWDLMSTFDESQHPRATDGGPASHVGTEQEGSLANPVGTVPDGRFDRPGPHVRQVGVDPNWSDRGYEWELDHGTTGLIEDDGKARWSVNKTVGFASDYNSVSSTGDDTEATLWEVDQHASALSHIAMHHTENGSHTIRLAVKKDGDELVVSSYDAGQPLGRVHADGSFSVDRKAARKSFLGLEYY